MAQSPASTGAQPAFSQPATAPQPGSITGIVVDKDEAVLPEATVTLTEDSVSGTQVTHSASDGSFAFSDVSPGTFRLKIAAIGFAEEEKSGLLQPGQTYEFGSIELKVADSVNIKVTVSQEEVAAEEIHVEEQQRVLGVLPNYYVSYVPDAAPLTTKQKFSLGWKSTVDPVSFAVSGFLAGVEQADDAFPGYGQGAQGYFKRFGATYADLFSGTFIGSAILPSIFKQDPRYFYQGTGSRKSRFLHAISSAVICKGDNQHWQPNYSSMLGALASGAISNLYYPASSRNGVGLTFGNTLIGIGGTAAGGVVEEFFLRRITPHAAHQ